MKILLLLLLSFEICFCQRERNLLGSSDTQRTKANGIKRLKEELFVNRKYDPLVIPIGADDKPLNVTIGLSLLKIDDFDVNKQVLTAQSWIEMSWTDANLHWDPMQFDRIKMLNVFPHQVYRPDITLYNSANFGQMKRDLLETRLIVSSNGKVIWVPPALLTVNCRTDLTKWPNDEHECQFTWGSWTHGIDLVDVHFGSLTGDAFSLRDYQENSHWKITETKKIREQKKYPCCPVFYPDLKFILRLKRVPSALHHIICIPSVTATILSLITFWFPIKSKIRFFLSGFSLLMLTSLLIYIGCELGTQIKGVPLIVRYLSLVVLLIGLSLIWSTIAFNIKSMPRCQWLDNLLPKLMKTMNKEHESIQLTQSQDNPESNSPNANVKSGKTIEPLIILIDKVLFIIFTLTILSFIIFK